MHDITKKLLNARINHEPIDFIRNDFDLNEAEAYEIQDELIEALCEKEETKIAGYKISMTSQETQAIAKTTEPAYGTLLQNHLIKSGSTIHLANMFSPYIEPEIMFILNEDLSLVADEQEILEKTSMAAGIEVPDARYKNWFPNFSLQDLLVDNTATGCVVMAEEQKPKHYEEMANIQMELFHNDEKISEGFSSAVLDNPVLSVKWLVGKLAKKNVQLKKGMTISSGTFISPLPVKIGTYRVLYSDIGFCEITFK